MFPRLKTFLSVFPISETTWVLRGGADEQWRIKLTDERAVRALGALLPYLTGKTSVDAILDAVEGQGVHRPAAAAVLRQLEATSLLEDADACGLTGPELHRYDHQIRYFSRFTQQGGAKLQAVLRGSHVALLADGVLGESLYGRLAGAGVGRVTVLSRQPSEAAAWADGVAEPRPRTTVVEIDAEKIWPETSPDLAQPAVSQPDLPQLLIVCQDAHHPRLLEAVDALSKRRGLPWLLVRHLDLQEGWIGPLFVPGETASYLSLEARLRSNMTSFNEYLAFDAHVRTNGASPAFGGLHAAFDLLASIAVIEAVKYLTDFKVPELLGRFLTINFWTWETELHDVLRLPSLDRPDSSRPPVFPWKVVSHEDGAPSSRRP